MPVTIGSLTSTECFVGEPTSCRQVVRVQLAGTAVGPARLRVEGRSLRGSAGVAPGVNRVEVAVEVGRAGRDRHRRPGRPGDRPGVLDRAEGAVEVAEPGWTVFMVSHFHYDPVWWNTQGAYTSGWDFLTDDGHTRPLFEHNGLALVQAHIDLALRDPDYRFVLAEIDYLKPFWDSLPQYREALRRLLAEDRAELMGGTYNEPNTNLTGSETTIRNIVYGVGYQRDIVGGNPQTGWQLDVFGHDPQFPGLLEAAGLTSSSWARGPFHQWGPAPSMAGGVNGGTSVMEFASEFEWISPSGRGVLTHYMPNHYSAGWWMDAAPSLEDAEEAVYQLFLSAKKVAATRHTLLPVGTDYTPPNLWVTAIHRAWNARYTWPRFICAIPSEFFAAVRAELAGTGRRASPQTRDMNPIYTGKDVSYIDTKQAQRAAEAAALDAERLATLACLFADGRYPERTMDKVWRHLAYGAHHDAITGSESDQVYLDLLAGWREAYDLATDVADRSLDRLQPRMRTSPPAAPAVALSIVNTLSFERRELVEADVTFDQPVGGLAVLDDQGQPVPYVVVADDPPAGRFRVQFVADGVPGLGWRHWYASPDDTVEVADVRWRPGPAGAERPVVIANDQLRVTVDPARGGCITAAVVLGSGRELIADGGAGAELRLYQEYPAHPGHGEGPWHLPSTTRPTPGSL